jgi:aryl-alcohol dehydrogenase-like predicted oxidoreductase
MEKRRAFLRNMAGITAGMMLPAGWAFGRPVAARDRLGDLLPVRKLGSTGEIVTMLGLGGYHVGWTTEKDAQEVIETAMEGGIRFFDTAHSYVGGTSEERYGKYLVPRYRDDIFLMSKTTAATGETLLKEVDLSLKRLNTDHLDLLQLHAFQSPGDVDNRIRNGVIDAIYSVRESGKARYIGFTGHQSPYAHMHMIGRFPEFSGFDTLQMPLSVVDFASEHSFVRKVVPLAIENNLGLLAMKTLAAGRFFGSTKIAGELIWEADKPVVPNYVSIREALFFSWTLPVSVLITGAENKELLLEKIKLAREFTKITEAEKEQIYDKVLPAPDRDKVEYYKNVQG